MVMLMESAQFELPFLKNEALVSKVSVSYLYQNPTQAWAFGIILHQIGHVQIAKRIDDSVYWYVPLIFMSEVVSEPHLMSCNSQISWYIDLKGFFRQVQIPSFPYLSAQRTNGCFFS